MVTETCVFDIDELNRNFKNSNYILYVNVRSLNANFDKLQVFLQRLVHKPCVIVCSETWRLQYCPYFNIHGYKLLYNESSINKSDGVVIYVNANLEQGIENVVIDGVSVLSVRLKVDRNTFLKVSAIYRCHDLQKHTFMQSLEKFIHNNRNVGSHAIVGDFNIDLLGENLSKVNSTEYSLRINFSNMFLESGYEPYFNSVTRPAPNGVGGTCIDNIFVKTSVLNITAYKMQVPFNDHYPLFAAFGKRIKNGEILKSQYIRYDKLFSGACEVSWESIIIEKDPINALGKFMNCLKFCMADATRSTNTCNSSKDKRRSEWITTAILNSCKQKDFLYHLWKKNPCCHSLEKQYKDYIKVLTKVIKAAKTLHNKTIIYKSKCNPRALWKIINDKLGKGKNKQSSIEVLDTGNYKTDEPVSIANYVNDFFCSIGSNTVKNINHLPNSRPFKLPKRNSDTIFLKPTNSLEISKILNEMKEKSGGVDSVNTKTLKLLAHFIVGPLAHIFNLCMEYSIWPDALKAADVVPIFKGGSKTSIMNYRPISLISNIAKIFEKIIYNRLEDFFTKYNIISKEQYGFVKGKGTKDALYRLSNYVYGNLDKSKPVIVAFLDLAKAFDTVNHSLLIDKLERYGVRGKFLELIKDYLTNRKQRVKIDSTYSDYGSINIGVPQGTILGPLLFVIYVNDLLMDMPDGSILSYADDTVVMVDDLNWSDAVSKLNGYLNKVADWLAQNKLVLNVSKTVFITFGNYRDSVPMEADVMIHGEKIKRVENCKYLGVIFDMNMRWEEHVKYLINKTKYLIFVFYKLKQIMNQSSLLVVYYALFHSIVNYGILAWGGAYKGVVKVLENVQNKIIKIIGAPLGLNLLRVNQNFQLEALFYHYKDLSLRYTNSTSKTRNRNIQLPIVRRTIGTRSSYIVAIAVFNALPSNLKNNSACNTGLRNKIKQIFRGSNHPL